MPWETKEKKTKRREISRKMQAKIKSQIKVKNNKEFYSMNIYIGNFSYETTQDDLQDVFSAFGQVESVKVIRDKMTGQSRGFGFVSMPNPKEAQAAMQGITEIQGKRITINEARPPAKSSSFGGNKGGPRGNNFNRRGGRY